MIVSRDQLAAGALVQVPGEPEHVRLVDVLEQREAAGHVAVERRVADRELGLVPGRDDEPAELVRERHQQHAADARLEVLLGEVGLAARERGRERWPRTRRRSAPIGSSRKSVPRLSASRRASVARALGREARRHRDAVHPLAARAPRRRARPSAPSRSRPRRRSRPRGSRSSRRSRRARARARAASARGRRAARRSAGSSVVRGRPAAARSTVAVAGGAARSRASARRRTSAEPASDRLGRVDVDDEQRLLEAGRAGDHLALVVEHERVAVEDQLVLAADRVAERDEARVVARARDEHLLALAVLADVERRGGDVGDELRAGEREVGRGRAGLPDVLADRRPDEASRRAAAAAGRGPTRSSGPRRRRRSWAGSACGRPPGPRRPRRRRTRCRGRGRRAARRRARRSRRVSRAISSRLARAARTKPGRRSRSSGG